MFTRLVITCTCKYDIPVHVIHVKFLYIKFNTVQKENKEGWREKCVNINPRKLSFLKWEEGADPRPCF